MSFRKFNLSLKLDILFYKGFIVWGQLNEKLLIVFRFGQAIIGLIKRLLFSSWLVKSLWSFVFFGPFFLFRIVLIIKFSYLWAFILTRWITVVSKIIRLWSWGCWLEFLFFIIMGPFCPLMSLASNSFKQATILAFTFYGQMVFTVLSIRTQIFLLKSNNRFSIWNSGILASILLSLILILRLLSFSIVLLYQPTMNRWRMEKNHSKVNT